MSPERHCCRSFSPHLHWAPKSYRISRQAQADWRTLHSSLAGQLPGCFPARALGATRLERRGYAGARLGVFWSLRSLKIFDRNVRETKVCRSRLTPPPLQRFTDCEGPSLPALCCSSALEAVSLQARRAAAEKHPLVLIIHNLEASVEFLLRPTAAPF